MQNFIEKEKEKDRERKSEMEKVVWSLPLRTSCNVNAVAAPYRVQATALAGCSNVYDAPYRVQAATLAG